MKKYGLFAGLGLILLVILMRLLPHASNITPLYAVALFAAAVFPRRWAVAVPMAAMVISDLIIGLHSSIAFTWSGMLVFALLGFGLAGRPTALRVAGSAILGSGVFFLWTNLGVCFGSLEFHSFELKHDQCARGILGQRLIYTNAYFGTHCHFSLEEMRLYQFVCYS